MQNLNTVYVIKENDTTIQQLTDAQIIGLLNEGVKVIRPETDQVPIVIMITMDDESQVPDLAWQDILAVKENVSKTEQPAA